MCPFVRCLINPVCSSCQGHGKMSVSPLDFFPGNSVSPCVPIRSTIATEWNALLNCSNGFLCVEGTPTKAILRLRSASWSWPLPSPPAASGSAWHPVSQARGIGTSVLQGMPDLPSSCEGRQYVQVCCKLESQCDGKVSEQQDWSLGAIRAALPQAKL